MGSADARAKLAEAYATGEEPRYVSVSGQGEFWAIGDVLVIVPPIPPGAEPQLEYALRLRRDAMLSGSCEGCGAVADVIAADGKDLHNFVFDHRATCPAADENIAPLVDRFNESVNGKSLEDLFMAAVVRTRESMDITMAGMPKVEDEEFLAWGNRLLDAELSKGDRCGHLIARPNQTWFLLLGSGHWLCNECQMRMAAKFKSGAWRLPYIEDNSCDVCRRLVSKLNPLVVRIDTFIMTGGACDRCHDKFYPGDKP
ncbi:hypothetical protein ACWEF6_06255 [Amycolatopsis sp. NPDC004772]